ncbi:MAG: SDR family oxidoreductase [Verrucomicrobia bacterium]|nr:SDR family oxidoreductase [Verrucomicrobiota bacterium]MBV8275680.1 SDR family oxidoreductase [Verrucomicrobiota bacterium]
MRIFVTGATGFIGTAVVKEFLAAGYQVTGLSRTTQGAEKLQKFGAKARVGRLDQPALLRDAAAESDGVIHLAFMHGLAHMDLMSRLRLFAGALNGGIMSSFLRIVHQTESQAVQALGSGLEGTGRPLIVTSGVLMLPFGKISTEEDDHVKDAPNRSFSETTALGFVPRGVRASVIRLSPTVHGSGDRGLIPYIIKAARKKGSSVYIGGGANRWPAVHVRDAARLFRLALEKGEPGAKYHGVDETGVPFRDIASKIAAKLQIPTSSYPTPKSAKHLGFLSNFVGLDNPSSSKWTQQTLGWKPTGPGLLADIDQPDYFKI